MATVEDIPQHVSQAILHLTDLGKVNFTSCRRSCIDLETDEYRIV